MNNTQSNVLRLIDLLIGDAYWSPLLGEQAAAELRRLHQHELTLIEWLEKTEWIQEGAKAWEFGRHRADVIKQRFDHLHALNAQLTKASEELLEALTSIAKNGCCDRCQEATSVARAAISRAESTLKTE